MRYLVYVLVSIIAFGCSKDSLTQPTTNGSILGTATDSGNASGVIGVLISTRPSTSVVTTDVSGSYVINNVPAGSYVVFAAKAGYKVDSASVSVTGGSTARADFQLKVEMLLPSVPTLLSPQNGASLQLAPVTFSWNPSANALSYRLQVSTDSLFSGILVDDSTITTNSYQFAPSPMATPFYWRVKARNSAGSSQYSAAWSFVVKLTLDPPTNLRAYSASISSVGLLWDPSTSESSVAFVNYALKVKDPLGSLVGTESVSKGNPTTVVTGLSEGVIYTFVLRSAGTGTILSADSASVLWSPARRLTTDSTSGPPIQVYEFASSAGHAGLQFYSASSGSARTQSLNVSNPNRALSDVFLQTNTADGSISLNNLASSGMPGPKNTVFSTVVRDATDLDDPQMAPPSISTYTLLTVQIPSMVSTQSKIIYAKSVTDNKYVRILLKRNPITNLLYSGTSPNRYITVQLSYQDVPGVLYAEGHRSSDSYWSDKGRKDLISSFER